MAPAAAGALRVPLWETIAVLYAASLLWYGAVTWIAFKVGTDWESVRAALATFARDAGIAGTALGVVLWLVVDVIMTGNNIANFGFAHALLDGAATGGGVTNGVATGYGQGCSAGAGQPAATASTNGIYAPGGAHFLTGQNLGANAPVLGIFGLSDQTAGAAPLPFTLPGTSCTLLASPDFTPVTLADATGAVGGTQLALSLPADPAISGIVLYEQLASLVAGANPWSIVFSDAVAVNLGSFAPPGRGTYMVGHDTDAGAQYANVTKAFGYAMRLRTL
jgi:hypothetical protein